MGAPFTFQTIFSDWQWSIFPATAAIVLLFITIWYLRSAWLVRLRGHHWSSWRTTAFLAGIFTVDIALQSGIVQSSMAHFGAHVLQHLLLMVVAPPLLALGAPSTLLLQSSARRVKTRWLAVLRSPSFAALSHPLVTFFLYFGTMAIFFLTPLINVAMHHESLMDLINISFLLGATLYWWPMIGIDPIVHWKMDYGARMLNILLGSAVEAFLGIAIIAESHPIASMYTVNDTHSGGALLWISTEFVTLGAFVPIYVQWFRSDQRAGDRSDLALLRRHRANNQREQLSPSDNLVERSLTPWELEWIARTGHAPQELRLSANHLDAQRPQT